MLCSAQISQCFFFFLVSPRIEIQIFNFQTPGRAGPPDTQGPRELPASRAPHSAHASMRIHRVRSGGNRPVATQWTGPRCEAGASLRSPVVRIPPRAGWTPGHPGENAAEKTPRKRAEREELQCIASTILKLLALPRACTSIVAHRTFDLLRRRDRASNTKGFR